MKTRMRILVVSLLLLWLAMPTFASEMASNQPTATLKDLHQSIQLEFQKHNYKKVIQLYEDFSGNHPDQVLPLTLRVFYSQSLADTGEIDAAIKTIQEILVDFPLLMDSLRLQYDLANLFFMQKRYEEARKAYEKVLLQSSRVNETLRKARERIALMKGSEGKKKDVISLQLLDIETALEAGEIPDGAETLLEKLATQNPRSPKTPQGEEARLLLARIKVIRTEKARNLLDEARRLFDHERKYAEVRNILEKIQSDYFDVGDLQSVEALLNEVNLRDRRGKL